MRTPIGALLTVLWSAAVAADPAACSAPEYRQFDFWLGEWTVTQNGKLAGTNRIDKRLGGCALLENWVGAGHSLNFYDAQRGHWQQTWIDNSGAPLYLTGHFDGGHMVLSGESTDPKTQVHTIDRITWSRNLDGSVRQLWNQSTDGGKTWSVAFDGLYKRK